jgi:hypothetical protein
LVDGCEDTNKIGRYEPALSETTNFNAGDRQTVNDRFSSSLSH